MKRRGPAPKPAHLKLIEGNPGRRPIQKEVEPDQFETAPPPPEMLSADAKEEWVRVAAQLHSLGLLTVVDIQSLAAYCQAYSRWVQAERAIAKMAEHDLLSGGLMVKTSNGNAIQNPLVGTAHKAASDMVRYAAEFGLTPAARSRLAIPAGQKPKSKFDGLLG